MSAHKVTARNVAERAGVSRSPVSMYRNRNPKVWISEAAKRRIDGAVRELQYRPNRAAQLLPDSGSYGEREFLAGGARECGSIRSACGTALRPATGIVAELQWFQPDALISFAGIDGGTLREQLGGAPFWSDSWYLPFASLARSDGSIVPGFREYVELLAEALLEVMGDPDGATRDLPAPARFLVSEERAAVRETMNNDPFFQTLGQGAVTWQCR